MSSPRPRPAPRPPSPPVAAPLRPTAPPAAPPPPPPFTAPPPPMAVPASVATPPIETEYTEQLIVPSQIALSVLTGVAAAVILLALSLWPLAIVAVLIVAAVVYYLGVQILTVTPTAISIAQGRGDKSPHVRYAAEIVAAEIVTLTWPQCYGLGLPDTVDTSRFTIRAGPAVSLTLRDGELLRISAANPQAVLNLLGR